MRELPYSGDPPKSKPDPYELDEPLVGTITDPAGYIPDSGLVDAVNVALLLRQPLLLTGEPGTGKSQLASSVAYQLGLETPIEFETKSTSVARDLFYTYDHVSRFRIQQGPSAPDVAKDFITYNALGAAIIYGNLRATVKSILPSGFKLGAPRRSVVLIDEIDKAPRDFPNDILNEIERLYFRIPELGGAVIRATDECQPIIIMTSNSEKSLPDAFLRRCIFYSIPFPNDDRLERIVLSRLDGLLGGGSPLLQDSMVFFLQLRNTDAGLRRFPGTAELLNWIYAMLELGCRSNVGLKNQAKIATTSLSTLSKLEEDQGRLIELFEEWIAR